MATCSRSQVAPTRHAELRPNWQSVRLRGAPGGLAEIYAALGEKDEALRWLEAAYEQRNGYLPWIGQDPFLALLRDDPRFEVLLRRLNVPRQPH